MPFVELHKTNPGGTGTLIMQPNIGVVVTPKGEQHVYFRIPRELVHSVWGNMLVNEGRSVKLSVLEGTDSDAGFIMMTHNPRGYTFSASSYALSNGKPSSSAFTGKINLDTFKSHVPNITPQAPTSMDYSVDGAALLLQLPSWFVYAAKPIVRASMVPLEKQKPGAPPRALTDQQRRALR